jgi:hypothetical protein
MTFQYILLITEWKPYLDMYSDVQGYKYNWFKSKDNKLRLIHVVIFTLAYITMLLIFSTILGEKMFNFNFISLLLLMTCYSFWDFAYLSMFDKALKHLPVLFYDIFIVGGLCLVLTQFIFNKYYKILEKNIPILVLLYFVTMFLFFYACYRYNPDISNITGVYEPFHLLFITFLVLSLTLYLTFY